MKCKKIIAVVLCAAMLLSLAPSASAQSAAKNPSVSEAVRVIDGLFEALLRLFKGLDKSMDYDGYQSLCVLPELDKGYVPQGYCYLDSRDAYAVSAYNADAASIISIIDAQTGERLKTLLLGYEDGSESRAHVGGLADIGDSILVTVGSSIKRIKLADIDRCEDYDTVVFGGSFDTDLNCSYACSYGSLLYVGEFYTYTLEGTYTSKPAHRSRISPFERSYALCEVFDLTDMDAAFAQGAVPIRAIAMPNSVQGIAFDGETLVTSISYGRNNDSRLDYYSMPEAAEASIEIGGAQVELIYLRSSLIQNSLTLPPLLEGIDYSADGRVSGVFESGAKKFSDGKLAVSDICAFYMLLK